MTLESYEELVQSIMTETGLSEREARDLLGPESLPPAHNGIPENEQKIYFLLESFPDVPLPTISNALKECDNDEVRATDILLNHIILSDSSTDISRPASGSMEIHSADQKHGRNKRSCAKSSRRDLTRTREIAHLAESSGMEFNQAAEVYARNSNSLTDALFSTIPVTTCRSQPTTPIVTDTASQKQFIQPGAGRGTLDLDLKAGQKLSARRIEEAILEHETLAFQKRQKAKSYQESGNGLRQGHMRHLHQELFSDIHYHQNKAQSLRVLLKQFNHRRVSQNTVDLHELTVPEAIAVAETELQRWLPSTQPELKLITGSGSHSHNKVARIKPAIIDMLNQKKLRYSVESGLVTVFR